MTKEAARESFYHGVVSSLWQEREGKIRQKDSQAPGEP